jgi:hypothetical protein
VPPASLYPTRTETTKTSAAANALIIRANTKSLERTGSASHVLLDLRRWVPFTVLAAEALACTETLCAYRPEFPGR